MTWSCPATGPGNCTWALTSGIESLLRVYGSNLSNGVSGLVIDEYYQRLRTTAENGRTVMAQNIAMGYGPITAAYADPANPEGRAVLSEILGVEVQAPRRPVAVGQELVRQWLKSGRMAAPAC